MNNKFAGSRANYAIIASNRARARRNRRDGPPGVEGVKNRVRIVGAEGNGGGGGGRRKKRKQNLGRHSRAGLR